MICREKKHNWMFYKNFIEDYKKISRSVKINENLEITQCNQCVTTSSVCVCACVVACVRACEILRYCKSWIKVTGEDHLVKNSHLQYGVAQSNVSK